MKNLYLFINKTNNLDFLTGSFLEMTKDADNEMFKINNEINLSLYQRISEFPLKGVYFGNEFCEFLLPDLKDIELVFSHSSDLGLRQTFVTPPVSKYGVKQLVKTFDYIQANYPETEIVFNDWGVMMLLFTQYPKLKAVAGRLMDKMYRDPRFSERDYKDFFTEEGLKYIKQSNATSPSYTSYLNTYNVTRIELDFVPQGFELEGKVLPLPMSLYIPYGFVTTGRNCMMRSLNKPVHKKFVLEGCGCSKNCQSFDQIMEKKLSPMESDLRSDELWKIQLFRKGNTVFFLNDKIELLQEMDYFDRYIYQPTLPM